MKFYLRKLRRKLNTPYIRYGAIFFIVALRIFILTLSIVSSDINDDEFENELFDGTMVDIGDSESISSKAFNSADATAPTATTKTPPPPPTTTTTTTTTKVSNTAMISSKIIPNMFNDPDAWFHAGGALALAEEQRKYRKLHLALETGTSSVEESRQVAELEKSLYPWAKKFSSLLEMKRSFSGRGIVVSVSSFYLPYVLLLLENLRILNNTLPIIGYYCGGNELSAVERMLLATQGLPTIDLNDIFSIDIKGYATKAFAALAAPFREIMVVDSDVFFLKNPEILFEDPTFNKTRTLFFRDRGDYLFASRTEFVDKLVPKPHTKFLEDSRLHRGDIGHEIDACLNVLDKVDRFYSLLATCKLNTKPLRTFVYRESLGDKETWFLGAEIMQELYGVNPHFPGLLGDNKTSQNGVNTVQGKPLYFDNNGHPMFTNGGLNAYKQNDKKEWNIIPFSYHFWGTPDGVHHILNNTLTASSNIYQLKAHEMTVVDKMIAYWKDIGKIMFPH